MPRCHSYLLLRPAEALLDLPGEEPGAPALGHGGGPGASALATEEVGRRSIRWAPPERLPLHPRRWGTRTRLLPHPPAPALGFKVGFGAVLVLVFTRVRWGCSSGMLNGARWYRPPNPTSLVAKGSGVWEKNGAGGWKNPTRTAPRSPRGGCAQFPQVVTTPRTLRPPREAGALPFSQGARKRRNPAKGQTGGDEDAKGWRRADRGQSIHHWREEQILLMLFGGFKPKKETWSGGDWGLLAALSSGPAPGKRRNDGAEQCWSTSATQAPGPSLTLLIQEL